MKKLLIVDDEVYIREIMGFDLRRAGYNVQDAENGRHALELITHQRFDLVISDIRMPSGSGIELLNWVQDSNTELPPLVFVTAFADVSTEAAMDLGAHDFIKKPVDKEELLAVVRRCLISADKRWIWDQGTFDGARSLEICDDILSSNVQDYQVLIGRGGVFVELQTGFPQGFEVLEMRISRDNSPPIEGFGQVRWVRQMGDDKLLPGVGIEFLSLKEHSRKAVLDHLTIHKPRAYIPMGGAVSSN